MEPYVSRRSGLDGRFVFQGFAVIRTCLDRHINLPPLACAVSTACVVVTGPDPFDAPRQRGKPRQPSARLFARECLETDEPEIIAALADVCQRSDGIEKRQPTDVRERHCCFTETIAASTT